MKKDKLAKVMLKYPLPAPAEYKKPPAASMIIIDGEVFKPLPKAIRAIKKPTNFVDWGCGKNPSAIFSLFSSYFNPRYMEFVDMKGVLIKSPHRDVRVTH
jgi:hypothetical protein